jgi:hypothetical protein
MTRTPPDALDADVLAALAEATLAEALAPAVAARVKRRLMARIAATETRHLTVPADGGQWQPFATGVQIKVLHEAGGVMSYLLRLAPGASIAPHRHPIDEECVVLEGTVRIGDELVARRCSCAVPRRRSAIWSEPQPAARRATPAPPRGVSSQRAALHRSRPRRMCP